MPELTRPAVLPLSAERERELSSWGRRVLHGLYDVLFVGFLAVCGPFFLFRALRDPGLRRSLRGRFGIGPTRTGSRPCVWVHGVSVGEIKAAQSLVSALHEQQPGLDLVVSSTTTSGYALARDLHPQHLVVQFPLDLSWVVRRVLSRVRPSVLVLMELEIWPNLLHQAALRGIPVLVVNGRISASSFQGYRRWRRLLPAFDLIAAYAVQNQEYAARLSALDVAEERVRVTGNLKYDNLREDCETRALDDLRRLLGLVDCGPIWVAGSTHPGEDEMVLDALKQVEGRVPGVRLVLAPRHIERTGDLVRLCERRGRGVSVLTRIREEQQSPAADSVLLVNTIGELETVYGLADVVFVGGSLVKRGGHNVLEPAALGKPVLFGPYMDNFREEERLLTERGAALSVRGAGELANQVIRILESPREAAEMGRRARSAVATMRGATERNRDLIMNYLNP